MKRLQQRPTPPLPRPDEARRDYVVDMIGQLAKLAREAGDVYVAIHLEAILAARRAIAKDRPA